MKISSMGILWISQKINRVSPSLRADQSVPFRTIIPNEKNEIFLTPATSALSVRLVTSDFQTHTLTVI